MTEVSIDGLVKTEHTFNGKEVYRSAESNRQRGKYLLYVDKECDGCGKSYKAPVNEIVKDETKGCSRSCARATSGPSSDSSSDYKGIFPSSSGSKWQAKIRKDGERNYLGSFDTKEEAARAYDRKALELYENPYTNFQSLSMRKAECVKCGRKF